MPHCVSKVPGGTERGTYHMIEIIHEEDLERTERKELPKDIRQIGKPDIGDRIYVENRAYEVLHPYDNRNERSAYILLGRFENYAGKQCVFVEAAIALEEIAFDGELPLWNDQTWGYVYRQMKEDYDSMAIVGWAMDIKGQLPNLTMRMEALHQNHFGGAHQVLFLMDSLEREEAFYGSRGGHLYRREGFYIYYDKKTVGQTSETIEFSETEKTEPEKVVQDDYWEEPRIISEKTEKPKGCYRQQILAREEKQQAPSYATSFLLLVVVCVFGVTAYLNYQKMNAMEKTLAQMNGAQTVAAQQEVIAETEQMTVKVEAVAGNVQKDVQAAGTQQEEIQGAAEGTPDIADAAQLDGAVQQTTGVADTANATTQSTDVAGAANATTQPTDVAGAANVTTQQTDVTDTANGSAEGAPALTEAQTYLAQGYYIVQKGDSLVGICKKIYQTTAMMDKLCEVNGIEDENAIYAGQRLTLPN